MTPFILLNCSVKGFFSVLLQCTNDLGFNVVNACLRNGEWRISSLFTLPSEKLHFEVLHIHQLILEKKRVPYYLILLCSPVSHSCKKHFATNERRQHHQF